MYPCDHCGRSHDTIAETRQCAEGSLPRPLTSDEARRRRRDRKTAREAADRQAKSFSLDERTQQANYRRKHPTSQEAKLATALTSKGVRFEREYEFPEKEIPWVADFYMSPKLVVEVDGDHDSDWDAERDRQLRAHGRYVVLRYTNDDIEQHTAAVVEKIVRYSGTEKCGTPGCGGVMQARWAGRSGWFLGCSNYEVDRNECRGRNAPCPRPNCGGELIEKPNSWGGKFQACTQYQSTGCSFKVDHKHTWLQQRGN